MILLPVLVRTHLKVSAPPARHEAASCKTGALNRSANLPCDEPADPQPPRITGMIPKGILPRGLETEARTPTLTKRPHSGPHSSQETVHATRNPVDGADQHYFRAGARPQSGAAQHLHAARHLDGAHGP